MNIYYLHDSFLWSVRHVGGITVAIRKSYSYSMADELLSMSWSQWENGTFVTKGNVSYAYDSYGRPESATESGGARVDYIPTAPTATC